jgi:hypothetical protein
LLTDGDKGLGEYIKILVSDDAGQFSQLTQARLCAGYMKADITIN